MADMKHVVGKNKGHVIAYTLSTCIWCKKTKKLLNDLGVDYYYIDVDLLENAEREKIRSDVLRWNPAGSYPTIVINDEECIPGYDEDEIRKRLGN